MKVGDLVTYNKYTEKWAVGITYAGVVIETGVYVGRNDVKILWQDGEIRTDKSRRLEVIK